MVPTGIEAAAARYLTERASEHGRLFQTLYMQLSMISELPAAPARSAVAATAHAGHATHSRHAAHALSLPHHLLELAVGDLAVLGCLLAHLAHFAHHLVHLAPLLEELIHFLDRPA
jgi:hypothetical protein